MRKTIGMRFLLKFLPIAFFISIALLVANPVFAAQPPYGMVFGDTWAFEGLNEGMSYSFSPIPAYREDTANGPNLILTQGTTFEFYYDLDVEITKLLEWDIMGRYTGDGPAVYEAFGDGSYTFVEPGFYVVFFTAGPQLPVEVIGNATAPQGQPSNDEIKVVLDGKTLSFDVPPQIINGRTLVPLRVIFEALGASVDWNDSTQTVTAVRGNTTVSLRIGSNMLVRNDAAISLDVPAQLINDRTMVPARAVAEAFEAKVDWIDATQTVVITSAAISDTLPASGNSPVTNAGTVDSAYDEIIDIYRTFKRASSGAQYLVDGVDGGDATDIMVDKLSAKLGITDDQKLYEMTNAANEAFFSNNLGYALKDINGDGVSELFFISDEAYDYIDFIFAIYTIHNGKPALVRAYWSRSSGSLGKDGTIYEHGSNGADDNFSATYRLDPDSGELKIIRWADLEEFPDSHTKEAGLDFISLS